MANAATKEFTTGLTKYTPRAATVNGIKGCIWVKRVLRDGAWVHDGSQHVRSGAQEVEVTAAFDTDFDANAAQEYWNQA